MAVERPLHILFADDEPADTELAVRWLRDSGLEFTWARVDSGPDLLDALRTRSPDLIISDYAMPAFSGLEALAIVTSHEPEIPLIILTGVPDAETVLACLDAGAWDYVLKEHVGHRLPRAVRRTLARRRASAGGSGSREALLESERRFRTLADSGRTLIWTSGPNRECDYVNQPWLDFTGRRLDQELGDGWVAGLHPDDLTRSVEIYTSAFDQRQPFSSVFRLRRHDGEYRWIQNDGTPRYDARGTFLGFIGHCLDITDLLRAEQDRTRIEAELIQAQKMEAVGRLAGGVAHDFNNLLTGILGLCDLLQASMPPASPDRADVEQIQAIAMRASTLTRQLLAFSRKQRLQQTRLSLTKLVSDLRKPLRTVVPEHIDLAWDLAPDLDDVDADPGQIEQAVYNLVTHACDAMPGGGRLTIRTSQVTLDDAFVRSHAGARPGVHVAISVTDTGPGIAPELLPLVFDPFHPARVQGDATGLGMGAVSGIVRQSGGCVAAEGAVGLGSIFTMYFPVAHGAIVSPPLVQPYSGVNAQRAGTILVVEDEAGLRMLLRRVLEGAGYTVLEAVDGQDAVTRWIGAAAAIDLLLTDVVMPGRSGQDVARLFRESNPGLVVLLMSGYTDPALFRDVALDDRTAILQKPYLPGVLVNQVRRLLGRVVPGQPGSSS